MMQFRQMAQRFDALTVRGKLQINKYLQTGGNDSQILTVKAKYTSNGPSAQLKGLYAIHICSYLGILNQMTGYFYSMVNFLRKHRHNRCLLYMYTTLETNGCGCRDKNPSNFISAKF